MEKKIAVVRDGGAVQLLTRLLVPGDVVLLVGGCEVPADIEWLEGDVLSVDTAALTGEPLPRKYPSEEYGRLILCGSTIRAGEAYGIVRKTGTNTEIGGAQAEIQKDKSHAKVSVFEERVLLVVKVVILTSLVDVLIIFFIQGFAGKLFFRGEVQQVLLTCLSIIIAAVPIALPLVLQVTMALGAAKMATHYHCVVTSLPALQDISSMTVLCSDKTGTLTTAKITIHAESVWANEGFTKDDVVLYAGLASSRDKKEDAIDRSVINHFDKVFGMAKAMAMTAEYTKTRSVGFNPIYKRVLFEYSHPVHGKVTVSKGLPNKVLDTADGGEDEAEDQWTCDRFAELKPIIKKVDFDFSKAGYKTLGVAVKIGDGPWKYVGILPMLDPPRHDTKQTIANLNAAGIEVKMITGDHLNIAKETARLVGLGVNIHAGSEIRDGSHSADELIHDSNGFAQVLPRDKREVVLVLKDKYKYVVGMTGDGVNDAPALSAAQCGVAVDDATDAAKNAAAIILTSPGLSAIYS
jgi:H+-transporting ATPase